MKFLKISSFILLTTIFFVSCNKEKNEETPKNMKVRMTDSPGDYAKLEVEITSVEAYHSNKGWITIENESQIVSVLDLTNGIETELVSETKVKSGVYTKLRLTFGNNNKIWINTEAILGDSFVTVEFDLSIALPENQFEIEIDESVNNKAGANILLDFNVAESIYGTVLTTFTLSPVITHIKDEKTGVRGKVSGSENVAVKATGNGKTYSTYTDDNGDFLIRGMISGEYTLEFMPTEDDLTPTTTVEGVIIVDGEIKSTGTTEIE